jgi:hypothetical protein
MLKATCTIDNTGGFKTQAEACPAFSRCVTVSLISIKAITSDKPALHEPSFQVIGGVHNLPPLEPALDFLLRPNVFILSLCSLPNPAARQELENSRQVVTTSQKFLSC